VGKNDVHAKEGRFEPAPIMAIMNAFQRPKGALTLRDVKD
jgi:hypothetical protein